jgi:hypothetical protein
MTYIKIFAPEGFRRVVLYFIGVVLTQVPDLLTIIRSCSVVQDWIQNYFT